MNNLYGWEMSEYLPYEEFKWLKDIDEFDVMSVNKTSPIRYLLEIDLKHPDEFNELHNDHPLAPERLAVSSDILSKYYKKYEINMINKLLINMRQKLVM